MARALMTPDELRRMDNDLCIIFEKGVKPIQAKKFYYFQTSMAKKLAMHQISHNDIPELDRGVWRKYNPYNPYVEDDKEKKVENLKVESLDDLFDDLPEDKKETPKPKEEPKVEQPIQQNKPEFTELKLEQEPPKEEAPILPQEAEEDELDADLQKELEAKFDELFGPLDDN